MTLDLTCRMTCRPLPLDVGIKAGDEFECALLDFHLFGASC